MCGRFALTQPPEAISALFQVADLEAFPPRYNIAPTQPIVMVRGRSVDDPPERPGSNLPDRKSLLVRWGFMPGWLKDPKGFPLLLNARAETAIEKATFRAAMRHRRTLIPASGFYEWRRGPKGTRPEPYWIRPRHGGAMAFGGLMETWSSNDGSEIDTGCVLTTDANGLLSPIHHRMPVVIHPEDFTRWLDCKHQEPRAIVDLMRPISDDYFEAIPISDAVNKVANASPDIQNRVERAGADKPQQPDNPPDDPQMSLL